MNVEGLLKPSIYHSSEGRQPEREEPEFHPKSVPVEVHSCSVPPDCLPVECLASASKGGARRPGAPGLLRWMGEAGLEPWWEIRRDGVGMRVQGAAFSIVNLPLSPFL